MRNLLGEERRRKTNRAARDNKKVEKPAGVWASECSTAIERHTLCSELFMCIIAIWCSADGIYIHIAVHMKVVVDVVAQLAESIPTHTIRRSATNTWQASGDCGSARLLVCRPKCTHVTHNTARIALHFTLVRVWLFSIVVGVHVTGSVGCLCSSFIVCVVVVGLLWSSWTGGHFIEAYVEMLPRLLVFGPFDSI